MDEVEINSRLGFPEMPRNMIRHYSVYVFVCGTKGEGEGGREGKKSTFWQHQTTVLSEFHCLTELLMINSHF